MVIVHLNDTHLHPTNPVSRVDSFNDEVFLALDQTAQVARHVKAQAIVHAGDWFHKASRISWPPLVQLLAWAAALKRDGITIYTIPGNHDLQHDRYESLHGLPIGVLFESGLFHDLSRRDTDLSAEVTAYGIPWPDASQPLTTPIPERVRLVVAHGFATPDGQPRYGQFCHAYETLAAFAPHVRVWHWGHDHSDHGVYTAQNGAKFINVGAAGRGTLDYETLTRPVKIAVTRFDGPRAAVQQIALKLKPVAEVFDLPLREKKQREQAEIEAFVAQLSGNLVGLLTVDYKAMLDGLGLETAVRLCVDQYIERAEG